ncbi:MAG TPA: sigma-70 family RNA polymerase sigma factor [Chloroflexota bacterium]|jgi:RNA polymerase sigma-70 factor (ECF subfamily)|nr:sigma-70 family RNA polymerase sigma factor [Chloroflexota bacterium]HEX2515326.1 sigma-70 family RNA polymerase sigma factor [Chloroflexota bacterium]
MFAEKGIPAHRLWGGAGDQGDVSPDGRRDYAQLDDETLVRLLVQQDVLALEALYQRYSRPIFSLALKILGDREVVEEVVQEVFLRLWTRAFGYDPQRGKLLSWLLTITHHRAIDELRRRRTQPEVEGLQEQLAAVEESDADPSRSLTQVEEREAVQRALAQLPEAQRKPIQLAYYGGLTQVEIAQLLSEPLGTIKTRMRLGMQKLRVLLASEADGVRRAGPASKGVS